MSSSKPKETIEYRELVRPNFGTFLALLFLIPASTLVSEPFDYRIGLVASSLLVITLWAILFVKAPLLLVTASTFSAGKASIPRSLLGSAIEVPKERIFQERGPNLDPASFKVFQGTVKTAVKIYIEDPEDPTPYWIVSTRQPKKLIEALNSTS